MRGKIPILIGGGGEKVMLRLVAQWADTWHGFGAPEVIAHKCRVLDEHCAAIGRDPAEIERSVLVTSEDIATGLLDRYHEVGAQALRRDREGAGLRSRRSAATAGLARLDLLSAPWLGRAGPSSPFRGEPWPQRQRMSSCEHRASCTGPDRSRAPLQRASTLPAMEAAPSDVLLVARCAQGDEGALAELYDRFGRAAYALALRIVRDATQAEDVVQEAFLDLWRTAARFDPSRSRPASYLLTFVHRRAVDLIRREQARPQRGGDVDDIAARAGTDDIPASLVASEQGASVRRALADLPPPQRQVLELAYFNGLSQSEIAERLGEPLGTVKSRTHVALARLRELLGEGFHA